MWRRGWGRIGGPRIREIFEQFRDKAIRRGGIIMFSSANALLVIDEARQTGVAVLGIDGFYLTGEAVEPSLENSIDFSLAGRVPADFWRDSEKFIRSRHNQALYFEIVLTEQDC